EVGPRRGRRGGRRVQPHRSPGRTDMSFFSKKYDLKKVWQDIKKDAEKARGGKKPGGKMGFEDLLDKLEKAGQSKTPDANAIMRQTADLAAKMKAYAASLPDGEHEFVADINGFVNILTEIARACEINARQIAAEHKELLLARNSRLESIPA